MRNLKRALSLALASVMLLGMMVVGTSASYPDVKATDNEEAIAVMQLLKVMTGDDKGNFNPAKAVTRNEMAVIMCKLLDLNTKDYAGSCPFTDVPAWAEPYVAACYANKIVSGTSATTYGGDQTVTTAQAALMVLKALGYFQYAADFGEDWMVSTVKQASKISLFDGLTSNANAALTRNDVAQMALNALEADVVDTDGNGGTTIKGEGFEITTGSAKYAKVENTKFDYRKDVKASEDKVQQLVEKLFDKDVTKESENDKLGRPATKWTYKDGKTNDVSVADKADAVYAGKDFDKDVIKDLTDDDKTIVASYYNGAKIDDTTAREYYTKLYKTKGITVELYDDDDKITVVILEAYAAQIKDIKTDDDDKVTKVDVEVFEASYGIKDSSFVLTIDADDDEDAYDIVKGYKEDDVFALYLKPAWDAKDANMDKVVLAAEDVEAVEGKVTAKSADKTYNGWIKIDGTKYDFANEYSQVAISVKDEGTYYIHNGYVLHSDKDANKSDDEYLFVVRKGADSDTFGAKTYYAEVVFTDGTSKTVELDISDKDFNDLAKSPKGAYSFTYDKDDDNYELTAKATTGEKANIEKGKTAVGKSNTANGKTVYVAIDTKDNKGEKFDSAKVYTGYKSVADLKDGTMYVVAESGKAAKIVFVLDAEDSVSNDNLIYISGSSVSKLISDDDLGDYYTYNAIVDGKIVEIMAAKALGTKLDGLYDSATVNSDGVYTKLTAKDVDYYIAVGEFGKAKDEVVKIDGKSFAYADDVVLYVIDEDGDITVGSIDRNYTNSSDYTIKVMYTMNDDDEIDAIYVKKATTKNYTTEKELLAAAEKAGMKSAVLVNTFGNRANTKYMVKDDKGNWTVKFDVTRDSWCGRTGTKDDKKEGDGASPTGMYPIFLHFGTKADPGVDAANGVSYTQLVDLSHFWVDGEVNGSGLYNKFVLTENVKDSVRDTAYGKYDYVVLNTTFSSKDDLNDRREDLGFNSQERLYEETTAYAYASSIEYNTNWVLGADGKVTFKDNSIVNGNGSCIFFHCKTTGATAGCISIPESDYVTFLKTVDKWGAIIAIN